MNRDEMIQAGLHADALLKDPTLLAAFQRLEADYVAEWKTAKTVNQRETCWALVRSVEELQNKLRAMVTNGQMEQAAVNARKPH